MANILDNPNVTAPIGIATEIANILGLNNWNLLAGSYNGITFHVVESGILASLERFNPAAGIVSSINGEIAGAGSSKAGTAINTNNALPYGTSTVSSTIKDQGRRKLTEHLIPGANFSVLEDNGFRGEYINVIGIMFGSSAIDAARNFFEVALDDTKVIDPANRNVLVHPIKGTIPKCYLESYTEIHSSETRKAIGYNLRFLTSQPTTIQSQKESVQSAIGKYVSAGVAAYSAVLASLGLAQLLFAKGRSVTQYFGLETVHNVTPSAPQALYAIPQFKIDMDMCYTLANTGVGLIQLLYQNLSSGTVNATVESIVVNPQLLLKYNSVSSAGIINGVTKISTIYANDLNALFGSIEDRGYGNVFREVIDGLKALLANVTNLGRTLIGNVYSSVFSYSVPYDMTLEEVLFNNNMDFNDPDLVNRVLSINFPSNSSTNLIIKGTGIQLPTK
jgi:hypothetical protein